MCTEDPVDLPTAEDPADPVGTGPEDRQIPQTKHTHVVFRIEIGRPVLVLWTRRVGLVRLRAGPFARELVNALAVAVVKVELQATGELPARRRTRDRKSTRLNSSHVRISYAVFCLK